MAEEIRKDPFEEFLKKSLATHEEPPPPDMWARIERQLPATPMSLGAHLLRWTAVAATVIVGLVAWQFVRYERRLEQLEHSLKRQRDTIALLQRQWLDARQGEGAYTPTPATPLPAERILDLPEKKARVHVPQQRSNPIRHPAEDQAPSSHQTAGSAPRHHLSRQRVSLPPALETTSLQSIAIPHAPLLGRVPSPPITLHTSRRGYTLGAGWSALHTTRKIKKPVDEHPAGPQKEFTDTSVVTSDESAIGLWSEIPIVRHFQLQTGILYRTQHTILRQQLAFQYGEGQPFDPAPHGTPHGHQQHYKQFFYTLNTANGAISLRLALEAQDTTQPIASDEQIDLSIRTRQRASYFTLPLALQHRRIFGRWSVAGSIGVWANVLVELRTSLEEVRSGHPLFRPDRATFGLQYPYLRDLYLEWMAGLRVEWQPTPALRLAFGPTRVGLLTPPHKTTYIRTGGRSIGWTATLQHLF